MSAAAMLMRPAGSNSQNLAAIALLCVIGFAFFGFLGKLCKDDAKTMKPAAITNPKIQTQQKQNEDHAKVFIFLAIGFGVAGAAAGTGAFMTRKKPNSLDL